LYLPDGPVMQDVVPPTLEDGVFLSQGLLVGLLELIVSLNRLAAYPSALSIYASSPPLPAYTIFWPRTRLCYDAWCAGTP
jgi:hypothetical protein